MRIHILSDLHLEVAKMDRDYTPPECDVVILAGDISPGLPGIIWAQETFDVPVIYVPGNHEFYHVGGFHRYIEKLKAHAAKYADVTVLYNDVLTIGDVRFIGTTLWTDYNAYGMGPIHQSYCEGGLADHAIRINKHDQSIHPVIAKDDGSRFSTYDALEEHQTARLFIKDELAKEWDGKTVVVTHHGPSTLSVHPRWEFHPMTPGFVSRLEDLMLDHNPELWVHGHVHDPFDYVVGETRVVANPRGYRSEGSNEHNNGFNPALVVKV